MRGRTRDLFKNGKSGRSERELRVPQSLSTYKTVSETHEREAVSSYHCHLALIERKKQEQQ